MTIKTDYFFYNRAALDIVMILELYICPYNSECMKAQCTCPVGADKCQNRKTQALTLIYERNHVSLYPEHEGKIELGLSWQQRDAGPLLAHTVISKSQS